MERNYLTIVTVGLMLIVVSSVMIQDHSPYAAGILSGVSLTIMGFAAYKMLQKERGKKPHPNETG
ncbi:hypothetical protein B0H94_107170 [Salsuginibacillus halophilus]|uniref:Uncharacterized protein n=1 Tax=Salsuginibacillus halophilus TaxID=517424 RepID=A0A2P8HG29_9BACI|nr:hypothetical protein [Salsuginibacillus halophilus]PSL45165.1 hypothetical protein B0H94_107170 [Salsuginibacillus halophilus]